MGKKLVALLLSIVFLAEGVVSAYAADLTPEQTRPRCEYIVRYADGYDRVDVEQELERRVRDLKTEKVLTNEQFSIVSAQQITEDELENINNLESVEYIVPDYEITLNSTEASDTEFVRVVSEYMDYVRSIDPNGMQPVIIGLADTGVDYEMVSSLYHNEQEIASNGVDDDENGYIDDCIGWNFVEHNNATNSEEEHGTVIANIISNITPNATIMPLKVASDKTGKTSDIIEAIEYAKTMGVDIINCSWGSEQYNYALKDAMETSGILFVCSVDNDPDKTVYPASFGIDNVISVGNAAAEDASDVDFAVSGIEAVGPDGTTGTYSGTSYAAAYITAAVALVKGETDASAYELSTALKQTLYSEETESRLFDIAKHYDQYITNIYKVQNERITADIVRALGHDINSDDVEAILYKEFSELSKEEQEELTGYFGVDLTDIESLCGSLDLASAVSVLVNGGAVGLNGERSAQIYFELDNYDASIQYFKTVSGIKERLSLSEQEINDYYAVVGTGTELKRVLGALMASKVWDCDFSELVNLDAKKL